MADNIDKNSVYRKYVFDEMSKNKQYVISDLERLVDSFSSDQIKQLCKYYSDYRKNCVYKFISEGPNEWKISRINISDVYVGEVNNIINPLLNDNGWSLRKISKDERIRNNKEFTSQGPIHSRSLSFISKKEGHRYRLVDGIHRAIRLACDNKKEFKLIYC